VTKGREAQIEEAAARITEDALAGSDHVRKTAHYCGFCTGATWADANPSRSPTPSAEEYFSEFKSNSEGAIMPKSRADIEGQPQSQSDAEGDMWEWMSSRIVKKDGPYDAEDMKLMWKAKAEAEAEIEKIFSLHKESEKAYRERQDELLQIAKDLKKELAEAKATVQRQTDYVVETANRILAAGDEIDELKAKLGLVERLVMAVRRYVDCNDSRISTIRERKTDLNKLKNELTNYEEFESQSGGVKS